MLGKALKGVRRESYEVLTKVYWPTGPGKNDRGLSRKHIMESVHASLHRLQTDHIDLYQFHRFDYETPLEESLSAFDDLIRQGKVMYIGFSEWNAEQIADAIKIQDQRGYTRFVSSQPQYSMLLAQSLNTRESRSSCLMMGSICVTDRLSRLSEPRR